MAIIVTFGSRVPVLQVSETAKFRWFQCSRIPETENVPVLQDSETSTCSGAPGFRNGKMSPIRVPPLQIRTWVWITCRFRSITSKLQFKWFGDIWEANLGNMNLVKPLLNISHYFTFRYWIWLLKWLL
ncbi:unnamed protein product [Rhizophagus irregularis]|nr:unnamed protein product [Rhizophagus irregularis]CAB4396255.1 unnamed protein product [Rhizophagus irregularis]CAB5383471.1 unnamed protein product [Rhizophagus irregularis]